MLRILMVTLGILFNINSVFAGSNTGFNLLTNIKKVPPSIGRCHMDGCSWSKPVSVRVVQKSEEQAILEVALLGGESTHKDGNYPDNYKGVNIDWDKEPHKVVITCSYKHPSVAIDDQIDVLPLNPDGVSGFLESSANLYFEYCHSYNTNGDNSDGSKRFGYNIQDSTPY